jgi:hypothetical protein
MDLITLVEAIGSREDLAVFVDHLRRDFENNPEGWENAGIAAYLEAMSACIRDMDGYYQNIGETMPHTPSWKTIGEILLTARIYE